MGDKFMGTNSRVEDNILIISPEGEIDGHTGPALTEYFKKSLEKGHQQLIADFSKVTFISSAGLRVLLATVKDARRVGGDLRIASIKNDVQKVLTVSGFDRLLKTFPDLPSAMESYSS